MAIARALAKQPQILLLDEAGASGERFRREKWRITYCGFGGVGGTVVVFFCVCFLCFVRVFFIFVFFFAVRFVWKPPGVQKAVLALCKPRRGPAMFKSKAGIGSKSLSRRPEAKRDAVVFESHDVSKPKKDHNLPMLTTYLFAFLKRIPSPAWPPIPHIAVFSRVLFVSQATSALDNASERMVQDPTGR